HEVGERLAIGFAARPPVEAESGAVKEAFELALHLADRSGVRLALELENDGEGGAGRAGGEKRHAGGCRQSGNHSCALEFGAHGRSGPGFVSIISFAAAGWLLP